MWVMALAASSGSTMTRHRSSIIAFRAKTSNSLSFSTTDNSLSNESGRDVMVLMTFLKSPEANDKYMSISLESYSQRSAFSDLPAKSTFNSLS